MFYPSEWNTPEFDKDILSGIKSVLKRIRQNKCLKGISIFQRCNSLCCSYMAYIQHTNVPNSLFDTYLSSLGYAELKVLLVIIRQTYGWKSKTGKGYKQRDWISRTFFVKKTGLSKRAVSKAIADLLHKQLITVTDAKGTVLHSTIQRKHSSKLYFSCGFTTSSDLNSTKPVTKGNPTIIKHTKVYREEKSLGLQKLNFKHDRKKKITKV